MRDCQHLWLVIVFVLAITSAHLPVDEPNGDMLIQRASGRVREGRIRFPGENGFVGGTGGLALVLGPPSICRTVSDPEVSSASRRTRRPSIPRSAVRCIPSRRLPSGGQPLAAGAALGPAGARLSLSRVSEAARPSFQVPHPPRGPTRGGPRLQRPRPRPARAGPVDRLVRGPADRPKRGCLQKLLQGHSRPHRQTM